MKGFLASVLILLTFNLEAKSGLKFYHLTREDGLSQSTINFIIKDYEGYFWFCTDDGVNKWNGYDFTHYTFKENDSNSIALGRASVIIQDEDSTIWVGSRQGGISKYNREQDRFNVYQIVDGVNKQNPSSYNYITSMIPFGKELLVGTLDNGVHLFNKQSEKFTRVKLNLKDGAESIIPIEVRFFQTSDSVLWLAHSEGLLRVIEITNNNGQIEFTLEWFFNKDNVITLFEDKEKTIWFGTLESGAFRYFPETGEIKQLPFGNSDGYHLNNPIVRTINQDNDGNVWLGTAGGGLNIYNKKTRKITYHVPQIGNTYTIGANSIYYIYVAPDSNMWVGTYNGGVSYTNWYKQSFNHVKSFGSIGDLNNNSILSFCETPDGKIWLGTDGGGINVFDPETQKHTPFKFPKKNICRVAKALETDKKGNIYIGTYRSGFSIYNYHTGKLQQFTTKTPVAMSSPDIWDVKLSLNEEVVWLATLGSGLMKYIPATNDIEYFHAHHDSSNALIHDYLNVLYVDSDDNLWIGSFNAGISMLPGGKGASFINYSADSVSGLSSNEVYSIFEDSRGNILVGTHEGGLNILDKQRKHFKVYRHTEGFQGGSIQSIIEDDEGYIWITSDAGLTKALVFSSDSVIFLKHYARKGLMANEFNGNAKLKTKDGQLYFGGVNGYNSFNPNNIIEINQVGKTILTAVYVFDQKIELEGGYLNLKDGQNRTKELEFKPWQRNLTFEFALLDYTLPELNTYEYRLVGFDKDWIKAGTRRRATYTNIDPGHYVFEARGINSQGIVDRTPVSFSFYIQKPFYRTTLFILLVVILISVLVLTIYNYRVRVYRKQEDALKKMVGERTKKLQSLNEVLGNQNKEINKQSTELRKQQKDLIEANQKLENSYKQIEAQNVELEKHRNNLEEIVKERTIELEMAKFKAEESEQLKMAFLSNMSHEIRTPMNAIIGFASLLADDNVTSQERTEYIQQVNVNSESLLILIDDILDLSKIEANQLLVKESVFEVNSFINELFFNWQHLHQKKNSNIKLKFSNELGKEDIFFRSDVVRIRQVINNLLDNAFKFTHDGEIELSIFLRDNNLIVSVRDTGIGISPEDITQIFNRFRKGEESGRKLYRGAGLGLTISNKLANLLGGSLTVTSEQSKGSTFCLSLPASLITDQEIVKEKTKAPTTTNKISIEGLHILIAEDEQTNFNYLKGILTRKNALVDWAKNGEEAVKMVTANQYDLVLMDIKMPVMNGVEATKKIRKMLPEQIIFAQTAFARPEEEQEFRKAGFNEYITKPIKSEILLKIAGKYFNK